MSSNDGPENMTPRWDVSDNNKRGMAHFWVQSTLNNKLARSHCGTVEAIKYLQGVDNVIIRCQVCGAPHGKE